MKCHWLDATGDHHVNPKYAKPGKKIMFSLISGSQTLYRHIKPLMPTCSMRAKSLHEERIAAGGSSGKGEREGDRMRANRVRTCYP